MRHRLIKGLKDLENFRDYVDRLHPEIFTFLSHHLARVTQNPNSLSGRRSTQYPVVYSVRKHLFILEPQPGKKAQKGPGLKDVHPSSGEEALRLGATTPGFGEDSRSSRERGERRPW